MKKVSRKLRAIAFVGLLIFSTAIMISCNQSSNNESDLSNHLEVKTIPIEVVDAEVVKTYTASLQGKVNVEVRAQASGYLEQILVKEGSYVQKGQPLFIINQEPYKIKLQNAQATLKAAEAALTNAQLEKDKVSSLLENKFVSPIQLQSANAALDSAKAAVAQAKAAVAEAKLHLSFCTVTAPVDGFLGRIPKLRGNLVTEGEVEPLTTMSDISQIYAYFSLSETDYFDLIKSNESTSSKDVLPMEIELYLSNGDVYPIKGKVDMINGEFDKETNALTVRAVFENPDKLLRNGGTGTVNLIAKTKEVIQIPMAATVDLQDKIFAFVLDKNNQVEQRQLKIVGKNLHNYFIREGVNKGEVLVTTGLDKITDGDMVSPLNEGSSQQISQSLSKEKKTQEVD